MEFDIECYYCGKRAIGEIADDQSTAYLDCECGDQVQIYVSYNGKIHIDGVSTK